MPRYPCKKIQTDSGANHFNIYYICPLIQINFYKTNKRPKKMKKSTNKMAYESPEICYLDLFNEGILCSSTGSTLGDAEEIDWGTL